MLSAILPSYKDPLLHKTIDSILENAEGEIEVIPVLDGYWPETPIKDDPRVKVVHLGQRRGMREAINAGVAVARGDFIMRSDEHCIFGKGFDKIMTESCQPNWIMTATRYFLDPVQWKVMDVPPFIHEKLKIRDGKFEGQRWPTRDRAQRGVQVSETMAMQGSFWIMPKKWWEEVIVALDTERYGEMYQDQHEMIFKTWKAGGKMMLNKNTWFAHKHYSFPRTHKYGSQSDDPKIGHLLEDWGDYYNNEVKPKWKI